MSDIEAQRGRLLTELRERRLWTRERLAREAGVSPTTVAHAEHGRTHIRLGTIRKLAEALDVDPQELLHPGKVPAPPSPEPPEEASGEERRASQFRSALERAVSFRAAREAVDRHRQDWETKLGEGTVNRQAVEEFLANADGFLHVLQIALDAELFILAQETGLAATDGAVRSRSEMHRAAERYMGLFRRLLDTARSYEAGPLTEERLKEKFNEWNGRISA